MLLCVGSGLSPIQPSIASAAARTEPTPAENDWSDAAIDAFIEEVRTTTLRRAAELAPEIGGTLPEDFLAWIDGDRLLRLSVYGCRADPLPVLLALRSLEIDLGVDTVRRTHTQLALAFAIQDSYAHRGAQGTPWNDADGAKRPSSLPSIAPREPLTLVIPGDPRVRIDTKRADSIAERPLDRDDHIINFLEDHPEIEVEVQSKELPPLEYDERGIAKPRGKPVEVKRMMKRPLVAADVIASPDLQRSFNQYMAERGHPDVTIDCGDRVVHWQSTAAVPDGALRGRIKAAHELFAAAYRAKGRLPAERDRAPTASESMAWFIRNDGISLPPLADGTARSNRWPMFPLNAPWPILLMLAADDQPLREREEIWRRFVEADEFRTYGEYIGDIAQQFDMQSARRLSPLAFDYGSIQMMWKDGGVCGTMGNIGARTYRICGVPAATAGQPGHCAIVHMEYDATTKAFRCVGGQYATGGDEVTTVHAGWNYDDVGGRRPMVYHQSIAWGVSEDVESLLETLAMRRMWDRVDGKDRSAKLIPFLDAALARTPFALAAIEGALRDAPSDEARAQALERFEQSVAAHSKTDIPELYRTTVREIARQPKSK